MSDDILPDKVRRGRVSKWLFTRTPQWALLMAELSDAGYRIYSLLLAHVNMEDDDGEAWPQQQTMADMLVRHRNSISRVITKELVPLGLADVEVERYGTNNTRRRNIYTIHELPPDGFDGWASLTEWYAAHPRPKPEPTNRRERKTAGQPGRTKNGASGRTTDGASGRTKNSAVTRRRKNKTKGEPSSPLTPSFERGPNGAGAGREDEFSTRKTKTRGVLKTPRAESGGTDSPPGPGIDDETLRRAEGLVDDAVRLWHKDHKAPSVSDRQRLSERVVAELAAGGDATVIVHEMSRDLHPSDAGSAVAVVLGSRTKTPGWGRSEDPRPDYSRYEVRTKTVWCGTCDERTRQVVVRDEDGGNERMARCRRCHPEAADRVPAPEVFEDQGDEFVETDPAVLEQMRASLAADSAAARERKERELAATRALLESIRSGADREEAARLSRR